MVRGDVGDEWPFRAPPRSATTVPSWNIDTLLPTPPPSRIYVKSNLQKGPNRLGVLAFKLVTCNDELDEEYDRGRVSKHARRREAKNKNAGKARTFGSSAAGAGSIRNPFQSKARSKASDERV